MPNILCPAPLRFWQLGISTLSDLATCMSGESRCQNSKNLLFQHFRVSSQYSKILSLPWLTKDDPTWSPPYTHTHLNSFLISHLSPLSLCSSHTFTPLCPSHVPNSACLGAFALSLSVCLEDSSLDICMNSSLYLGLCSNVILPEKSFWQPCLKQHPLTFSFLPLLYFSQHTEHPTSYI